jgi:hypothetical protein
VLLLQPLAAEGPSRQERHYISWLALDCLTLNSSMWLLLLLL